MGDIHFYFEFVDHYVSLYMKIALLVALIAFTIWRIITQQQQQQQQEPHTMHQPVVVVGTGLAGLTSTYNLLQRQIPVILIEKTDKFGGNSMKASSGINGAYTSTQERLGINDTVESFLSDTSKSGGKLGNTTLQRALVNDSKRAITWLQEDIGVPLDVVNRLGGHSNSRTHRSEGIPPGFEIISKLKKKVEAIPHLDVRLKSKLIGIDVVDHDVKGVEYIDLDTGKNVKVETENVIMATGGFGFSKELLKKYKPEFVHLPTTNGEQTLGEGQVLLENVGAELIDMDQVQIHPTGFIKQDDRDNNWKFLAAESLRGVGGVLLNENLDRFVNELTTRDKVSQAILSQEGTKAYLVLNEDMYNEFKFQIDFYMKMNLIKKTTLAERFSEKAQHAVEVLTEYSSTDAHAHPRDHKAHVFKGVDKNTTLYIGEVTPVVHFTMGGVKINENGQVMSKGGQVVKGLYAAGEVSGGVHGQNRLGGNSLLECVVFGKRAADDIK